jgi:hypothetical protein
LVERIGLKRPILRDTVRQVMQGLKKIQLRPGIERSTGTVTAFVEHEIGKHLVESVGVTPDEIETFDDMRKPLLQNREHGRCSSMMRIARGDRRRWTRSEARASRRARFARVRDSVSESLRAPPVAVFLRAVAPAVTKHSASQIDVRS